MLQRVLAATSCVLGLVAIALAVASVTVWRPADTLVATTTASAGHPLLVTDAGVLDLVADEVRVEVTAPDDAPVVLAVGRTQDVVAWVGEDPATYVVALEDVRTLATRAVTPPADEDVSAPEPDEDGESAPGTEGEDGTAPEDGTDEGTSPEAEAEGDAAAPEGGAEAPEDGTDAAAPGGAAADPRGSDLWVEEVRGNGSAVLDWTAEPGRWSLLAAAPGSEASPALTMTWPREVRTPFLVPGLVVGSVLLLGGLAWLVLLYLTDRASARGSRGTGAPAPAEGAATEAAVPAPAESPGTRPGAEPGWRPASWSVDAPSAPPAAPAEAVGSRTWPIAEPGAADGERPLTRRELRLREQEARRPRRGRGRPGEETGQTPVVPPEPPAPGPVAWSPPAAGTPERSVTVSGEAWRRAWGLGAPLTPGEDPADRTEPQDPDHPAREEEGR